ncbi:unnamed protein product [Blumeria hordei]|uniref:Uncharacterized protein n=1 Tax=Blumeria hordei TaxID=2867405 RepID=A0A383UM18_BLUHO|nr:unnamed protein product [Blumeria hordei]
MFSEHKSRMISEELNPPRESVSISSFIPSNHGSTLPNLGKLHSQSKIYNDKKNIIPPERPQSTPFPEQEMMEKTLLRSYRTHDSSFTSDYLLQISPVTLETNQVSPLCDLPSEIHECILDYLLGIRASAASMTTSTSFSKFLRGWSSTLRHSRRREVSQLALVSRRWRELIQERLYRHLKIKGTRTSINDSNDWFQCHPHLSSHIRHLEIWFPVFQQSNNIDQQRSHIPSNPPNRPYLVRRSSAVESSTAMTYQSPSDNCTLEEVFQFIQTTFARVCILTLEGGERKKPPMVRYFQRQLQGKLPTLTTVQTLVCKGQWNIIRSNEDFQILATSLPNLREWHASYAKPKSKSYLSMATILPRLPQYLTHLNICLEADYRRETFAPDYAKKVVRKTHFCIEMAKAIPTLEHLVYTGRICQDLFNTAAIISDARESRVKSVDIVVKNVCRPSLLDVGWGDGSSITDMKFIVAFEKLVVAAIRSLGKLSVLEFLRIRFIDLESPLPSLNPYFQLSKNQCTGIWSHSIVESIRQTRPTASFAREPEALDDVTYGEFIVSASSSKSRSPCIRVSNYAILAGENTLL